MIHGRRGIIRNMMLLTGTATVAIADDRIARQNYAMRRRLISLIMLAALVFVAQVARAEHETPNRSNGERVIAIDVLLVPDAAMVGRAEAANAKLRENYPAGYALGLEQAAHITLVHRYVRKKDMPAIEAAVAKIAAK